MRNNNIGDILIGIKNRKIDLLNLGLQMLYKISDMIYYVIIIAIGVFIGVNLK